MEVFKIDSVFFFKIKCGIVNLKNKFVFYEFNLWRITMKKIVVKLGFIIFVASILFGCAGFPGVVAKYGDPGCKEWSKRIAYRQVCADYSSNGHCRFWRSESYLEDYCVEWKTKEEVEYERSGYNSYD